MKGKSFWNRIDLPCLADILELQATARAQTQQIHSLIISNNETISLLEKARADISAAVDNTNGSQKEAIKSAVEKIVEAIRKYYESSSQILIQQSDKLSGNSNLLTALKSDTDGLFSAAQKQEDTIASMVQLNQGVISFLRDAEAGIIRSLGEESTTIKDALETENAQIYSGVTAKLDTVQRELSQRINQNAAETRKAVDCAVDKWSGIISDEKSDILQRLSQQMAATTNLMKELTVYRSESNRQSKTEYEQIQKIFNECKMQSELLRLLTANSMIEDISRQLDK